MKLRTLLLLAASLALSVGCRPGDAGSKKKRVVTTFTIIQDMAQNVAGDAAIVESITKPGAEIHEYEPTPLDIVKAQHADLVLWNGMGLERWFEKFFAQPQERAERGAHRGHRADGHRGGPLQREAEPAQLDVAGERDHLRGEHPQGAGEARSAERRRTLQRQRGRLHREVAGDRRADPQEARGDSGGAALAGEQRRRVFLPRSATTA